MVKRTIPRSTADGFNPASAPVRRARTGIFLYYLSTAFLSPTCIVILILPDVIFFQLMNYYQYYCAHRLWFWGGIRYRIEGEIPEPGSLVASKHQSQWETVLYNLILNDPVIAFKQELLRIPIWNWYLLRLGMFAINRRGGISSLRKLLTYTKRMLEQQRTVIIFPEGTRSALGQELPLHGGVYSIYKNLQVAVYPAALNSAKVWGKYSPIAPGIVDVRFHPPIKPGLSRTEFEAKLQRLINTL